MKKKNHRCVESGLEEGIMEPETNDEADSIVRWWWGWGAEGAWEKDMQ